MNQKGFVNIVLVLVILVLAGGVGYFALTRKQEPATQTITPQPATTQTLPTQTPTNPTPVVDETANWKTYRNDKYGFEFSFPSYYGRFSTDGPVELIPTPFTAGTFRVHVTIDRSDNFAIQVYENKNIQELTVFYENTTLQGGARVSSEGDISVDGARGTEFIVEGGESVRLKYVLWTKNGLTYEFIYGVAEQHKNMRTLEKIFSTFKFVK